MGVVKGDQMILNIGPQHPATHGTLRVVVKLDGERVVRAEPIMGYMHRGYEKLAEVRTYPQVTTLVNRIDWLGSFANEVPFILAAERLMDVEAPPRAQWIRTVLFELSRIANVVLFLGDMGVQLGAVTPVFFAFRDREFVLNQIEAVTGGRFHPNFDRIGGLKDDLPKGWTEETKSVLGRIRTFCNEMEDLVTGNEIFQARTRSIGVIPADMGLAYGLSGANIRASGVDWDLRRDGGGVVEVADSEIETLLDLRLPQLLVLNQLVVALRQVPHAAVLHRGIIEIEDQCDDPLEILGTVRPVGALLMPGKGGATRALDIQLVAEEREFGASDDAVSYTHLTLPTNREV